MSDIPATTTPPRPRRVVVFGLGGTIAMASGDSDGVVPALSAEQLVAAVPGLTETGIQLDVVDFRRVPSGSLTFDDLDALAQAIDERLATGAGAHGTGADHADSDGAGVDGIVVTQGTDTIEETAYLLDLVHTYPHPVVVTGAMRPPAQAGADGPGNLLAAIQAAASPLTRDLGVVVVFADEIHAASRVRKTHTTSGFTFQSPNGGPLGYVVEGRPRVLSRPATRTVLPAPIESQSVEIGLLTMVLGDSGAVLEAVAERVDGLVVAGFGAGHVPGHLVGTLDKIAARMPVVLASRTGAGSVLERTYGYPGSETDLLARGLISAGFLDPIKARILLRQLLAGGHGHATMVSVFASAGGWA